MEIERRLPDIRTLRLLASIAILVLPCSSHVDAQDTGRADADPQVRLSHLTHALELLKQQRAKVASPAYWHEVDDTGRDMQDVAWQTLADFADKQTVLETAEGISNAQLIHSHTARLLKHIGMAAAKGGVDVAEFQEKLKALDERGDSAASVRLIDQQIKNMEVVKSGSDVNESVLGDSDLSPIVGAAATGSLTSLYWLRASRSETSDEKLEYRMKALKEASEYVLKSGTEYAPPETKALAMLVKVDGELLARLAVFGGAEYLSAQMKSQAEALRQNALFQFDQHIAATDMEIDKANRAVKIEEHHREQEQQREAEPGGIKFNASRADDLAMRLDMTSINYDPAHGRLILVGKRSRHSFDLKIFADVLRLAAEQYEPFFSLDPSNPADWDSSCTREARLLSAKYSPDELASLVRKNSPPPIIRGNRAYYYAPLDEIDPELIGEANRGRDTTTKVVFSPAWLRGSELGWILYEADVAIKGIASGFLDFGSFLKPSPAWSFTDFDPVWLARTNSTAGRANFELDASTVPESEGCLDLTEIRPRLYVTDRKAGTDQDLSPSERCLQISEHFQRHWNEYVDQVPAIGRLEMIYRAYVAARLLIRKYPGLADRIKQLPRPADISQPPLTIVQPHVLRVCYEDDKLVSLIPGKSIYYDLGGGYGGGVDFKVDEKVGIRPVSTPSNGWVTSAFASGETSYVEHGNDEAAVALNIGSAPAPSATRGRLALWVGCLSAFIALGGLFARRFDWQRLSVLQRCRHCERLHGRLGAAAMVCDAIAAAALFYLIALPFMAAMHEAAPGPKQVVYAVMFLLGSIAALTVLGSTWQRMLAIWRPNALPRSKSLAGFVCSVRGAGILVGGILLSGGCTADAVASQTVKLCGDQLGERLLGVIGATPLLHAAALCAAGTTLSLLLRWGAPKLFNTRPLFFLRSGSHEHAPARQTLR